MNSAKKRPVDESDSSPEKKQKVSPTKKSFNKKPFNDKTDDKRSFGQYFINFLLLIIFLHYTTLRKNLTSIFVLRDDMKMGEDEMRVVDLLLLFILMNAGEVLIVYI